MKRGVRDRRNRVTFREFAVSVQGLSSPEESEGAWCFMDLHGGMAWLDYPKSGSLRTGNWSWVRLWITLNAKTWGMNFGTKKFHTRFNLRNSFLG